MKTAIPLSNIISASVFTISWIYKPPDVPEGIAINCVIHQHFVAKNLSGKLHKFLQFIINVVKKIQSNAIISRLLAQLCNENDQNFH